MSTNNMDVIDSSAQLSQSVSRRAAVALSPTDSLQTLLVDELNPVGPIQAIVVREVARRAGQMEGFDDAIHILRLAGQTSLTNVLSATENSAEVTHDIAIASVVGSERHEAIFRQGLAAAGGFFRALNVLSDLRAAGDKRQDVWAPDPRFASEQACHVYLVRRFDRGLCGCRRCDAVATGSFVATRVCWQCGHCQCQTGLRSGTCMERSSIPLTKWFAAIRIILTFPMISVPDLAAAVSLNRQQTVQCMIRRIRGAMAADNASQLLAGLDELYLGAQLI